MVSISPCVIDLADAAQLLAQDLDFSRELIFVGSVLIVAAAATREQRARRRDASGDGSSTSSQLGVDIVVELRRGPVRQAERMARAPLGRRARRARPSPPYTHFSIRTSFTMEFPLT